MRAAARLCLCVLLLWYPTYPNTAIGQSTNQVASGSGPNHILNPAHRPIFRDATAVDVLQKCLSALGGVEAQKSVITWTADADFGAQLTSGTLHWEANDTSFRIERTSPRGKTVTVSNQGQIAVMGASTETKAYYIPRLSSFSIRLGVMLAEVLRTQYYSIERDAREEDAQTFVLRIVNHNTAFDEGASPELWSIDKTTMKPSRSRPVGFRFAASTGTGTSVRRFSIRKQTRSGYERSLFASASNHR